MGSLIQRKALPELTEPLPKLLPKLHKLPKPLSKLTERQPNPTEPNRTQPNPNQTQPNQNKPFITEKERAILQWIKKNPTGVQQKYAEEMNIPVGTVKYNFYRLREKKLIRYVGSVHNGHWEILVDDAVWQN